MELIYKHRGYEIFAHFDKDAELFELFTDTDGVGYVGCADDLREAKQIAKDFVADNL